MKITYPALIRPAVRGWALTLAVAGGLLAFAGTTQAQPTQVYYEDFEVDNTQNWIVNYGLGANVADFYFDYSSVGIPPAPHTVGGTTRGLKLQANVDPNTQAGSVAGYGLSVSPMGFSITENFEMRFDMWLNYNASGLGSTQIGGAGFGTAGTQAQRAMPISGVVDSIFIGASTDGGTAADYRVYSPVHYIGLQDASGVYAAGSRNNTATYYVTNFPGNVAPPAAQTNLFPSQASLRTPDGTVGMQWRDVALRKVANIITYRIDGVLIATIDASTNGTLGGANILFNFYDIQGNASTDPLATNLLFALFDNVRITNFPSVVTVSATTPDAAESGPTPGIFTLTRSEPGPEVTVFYEMSGTASNGIDYVTLPGSITFAAGATSTNITLTPIDDNLSEFAETATLTISEGPNYYGAGSATVTIADNDTPTIDISTVLGSMYEPLPHDYVRFRLTRRGDLQAPSFNVNLVYSGEAAATRHTGTTPVTVDPGSLYTDFDVNPIDDNLLQGNQTIVCTVTSGTGYAVGTTSPSATATIVDDELPAETILFADDFNTDTSANWMLLYASTNAADNDYSAIFNYDYSQHPYGPMIPPAPRSGTDTHGLFLQVNKGDATEAAAALNLYPRNQNFTGNFAVRFDMYLIAPDTATTEYALFGINHSGNQTNWFRNSAAGFAGVDPVGWTFDGLFYGVETDAAALGDYVLYSAPTTAGRNPTALNSRSASTLTGIFKKPPYGYAGSPGNLSGSSTPCWSEVEISQVGNLVTLKINQTEIFSYTNNTAFTSGNIMIGHCDAYDSAATYDGGVIYDNVRVIRLPASLAPATITSIQPVGGPPTGYLVNYTGGSGSQFVLLTSPTVTAPLSSWTRAATNSTGSGAFSVPAGAQAFYRIKSE